MKLKFFLVFAVLFSGVLTSRAQTAAAVTPENTAAEKSATEETALRQKSFDIVWNTVNEKHYDPTFGGVDWQKVREIYEPQALAAQTRDDFHAVLRRMLGELKLSHFGVYPRPLPLPSGDKNTATAAGTTGIEIKMIEDQPVIARLEKDSAADKAGLKTGFAISKIGEKTVSQILAPLEKAMTENKYNERVKNIYRERAIQSYLDGKVGTTLNLEVLNAAGEPQTFDLVPSAAHSEMSEAFGNFPPQKVAFEARRLDGNIGYIRFNIWVIPQMAKIRQAMTDFADTKGVIFDLRGNPGGIGGLAIGVAGLLSSERISLGTMHGRGGDQNFAVFPQANPYKGKIIILSDYGTGSTSEVFAAGLQADGRATVVGETSAGAVLPSVFALLPTGAIFQYAISDYKSPNNILIEGRGVTPDITVAQTREALLTGRDAPLDAAVKAILN